MKELIANSYATLFDPVVARAVAARAAQWNLPRHDCHPLDRYPGRKVAADLAAYDAEVELAPTLDEDLIDVLDDDEAVQSAVADLDFDDEDDDNF